jgi:hypothetical protein
MSDERIAARIRELEAAEKETEQQLIRIRVVLAELRALLTPPAANGQAHEPLPDEVEAE